MTWLILFILFIICFYLLSEARRKLINEADEMIKTGKYEAINTPWGSTYLKAKSVIDPSTLISLELEREKNSKEWDVFLKNEIHPILGIESIVEVIENFYKVDGIRPDYVKSNLSYFYREPFFLDGLRSLFPETKSIHEFMDESNWPIGFQIWAIIAYPDVINWYSAKGRKIELLHLQVLQRSENNKIGFQAMRPIIDYYKVNINYQLECGVRIH